MAWERPTLAELIKRTQADMESEIDGVDAKVRRRNLNIIAKVIALVAHTLYGFIAFIAQQIIAIYSQGEYLARHASFWLDDGIRGAEFSSGPVVFNGSIGSEIEEDTILIRSDGVEFRTDESGVFSSTSLTLNVTAEVAGLAGDTDAGTILTLSQPIDGVSSNAIVDAAAITGGADVESEESVQERIKNRVQNPPHGGADHDYVTWAKEVPGVTRAWVYRHEMGAGTVTVRFVRDNDDNIIPSNAEVAVVQAKLNSEAPVTATAIAAAPIAEPLDFTIGLTPNTPEVQAAVIAQLDDLIKRESIPGGTLLISHIREAISLAAGEKNYVMPTPNADITRALGKMTTLGNFTWTS